MIAHLKGTLIESQPGRVVLEVHGVGYEVFVPMTTFHSLPDVGSDVSIGICTHVREDLIQLYGFGTLAERTIFEKLTAISGIGPRLALVILSGDSVAELIAAFKTNDVGRLTRIPGVGKKTAERILLEMRDKLREFVAPSSRTRAETDVLSALENLGYGRGLAEGAIRRAVDGEAEPGFDTLFKRTLQMLTKG